jgi:hypothetical protein
VSADKSDREQKQLDLRMEGLLNLFLALDMADKINYVAGVMNKVFTARYMGSVYWPAGKCHQSPYINAKFVKWLEHFVVSGTAQR